mmetsp:Transcript_98889/g.154520  ORF Transcript_98889/g.154520 Transcript_98889/m.154520 type:complete len:252 (-) Transcript_98889:91-846(-)
MSQDQIVNAICSLDDDAAVKVITDTLTLRPEVAPVVVKNACPDLAFAPASSFTARRSAGYVKQAADPNGFGLIENPELKLIFGQDVTAHRDQLGALEPGAAVNFAVLLTDDEKPQAFDVLPGHEGASKPVPVNASHLAAAQLLQALSAPKQVAPPPNNNWGGDSWGDSGWNPAWNQGGWKGDGGKDGWKGDSKDGYGKGGYDCKGGWNGGKDGWKGDGGKDGWMGDGKGGWNGDFGGGWNGDGKGGGKGKW